MALERAGTKKIHTDSRFSKNSERNQNVGRLLVDTNLVLHIRKCLCNVTDHTGRTIVWWSRKELEKLSGKATILSEWKLQHLNGTITLVRSFSAFPIFNDLVYRKRLIMLIVEQHR